MNTLRLLIVLIIGIISLTNFVFAQGEAAPTTTGVCQACSSGSPLMASYMTMMSEVITALGGASNLDPGGIAAQGYNINTKQSWSKERSSYISDSKFTITNQARGIASDMRSLDKTQERIVDAGNTLINTKFQYDKQVETKVISDITTALNKQVGNGKIFAKQGRINTPDYGSLMRSLIQLHKSIIAIPSAKSGYSFTWQGYQSNTTTINQMISYYSCAQDVTSCNQNTPKLRETGASVRGYRGDIVRARQSIKATTTKAYRDTGGKSDRPGLFSKGGLKAFVNNKFTVNIDGESASTIYQESLGAIKQFGGEWKQLFKDQQAKRAAKEDQIKTQNQVVSNIEASKDAVRQGGEVAIEPTNVQPTVTNNAPAYSRGEIGLLSAALNAANDQVLSERIETQRYTISNDSTPITYQIPKLTRQIYHTTQAIKNSTNQVIRMCKFHCSNVPGECGQEVN